MRLAALALFGAALLATRAGAEDPRVLYQLHCQGCHLADGSGSSRGVPALRGSVARFLQVSGGRAYLVRVPGSAMAPIDDAALAALLNWLVARFGPEEVARSSPPFSASEVAAYRARPLTDVEQERARLLAEMSGGP